MARKKKILFGANEKATDTLNTLVDYSAPQDGYPITFGKGEWLDGVLEAITNKDNTDAKVRFIWKIDDTDSGAVYAGNKLVSSKILDIFTNATDDEPATEVTVKFIDIDSTIQELKFGVVDPTSLNSLDEKFQALEDWAKSGNIITPDTSSPLMVTPSNEPLPKYTIDINVDGDDVSIVENKIVVSKYFIEKIQDSSTDPTYASQYKLMVQKPGTNDFVQAGDTINIFKDFVLKAAHVCTFNKNADGSPYEESGETPIGSLEIYAEVDDVTFADITVTYEGKTMYLEKAPTDKNLFVNHTYLHLLVNTMTNDEKEPETGNDSLTDVYLDFTEIIGGGAFAKLDETVNDISTRLTSVEGSYIKNINIPDSSAGEQFKTIEITTSVEGNDILSSFDIPDKEYYDLVAQNFDVLTTDCSTFANSLTWKGLD